MESPWREHFRGSGCEGEGWRRRPLEWVLAIFGTGRGCRQPGRDPWAQQVGKKMGTGSVESDGVKSLTRGQGRDSFWKPEKVVPPTHEAPSLSNVTLFPLVSRPSPALGRVPTAHGGAGANQPHFAAGRRGRRLRPKLTEGIWHRPRPPTPSPAPQKAKGPHGLQSTKSPRGRPYLSAQLGRCSAASRSRSGFRRCALTPPPRTPRNLSPRKGAES